MGSKIWYLFGSRFRPWKLIFQVYPFHNSILGARIGDQKDTRFWPPKTPRGIFVSDGIIRFGTAKLICWSLPAYSLCAQQDSSFVCWATFCHEARTHQGGHMFWSRNSKETSTWFWSLQIEVGTSDLLIKKSRHMKRPTLPYDRLWLPCHPLVAEWCQWNLAADLPILKMILCHTSNGQEGYDCVRFCVFVSWMLMCLRPCIQSMPSHGEAAFRCQLTSLKINDIIIASRTQETSPEACKLSCLFKCNL